jgi:hypothetical protein
VTPGSSPCTGASNRRRRVYSQYGKARKNPTRPTWRRGATMRGPVASRRHCRTHSGANGRWFPVQVPTARVESSCHCVKPRPDTHNGIPPRVLQRGHRAVATALGSLKYLPDPAKKMSAEPKATLGKTPSSANVRYCLGRALLRGIAARPRTARRDHSKKRFSFRCSGDGL